MTMFTASQLPLQRMPTKSDINSILTLNCIFSLTIITSAQRDCGQTEFSGIGMKNKVINDRMVCQP